MTEMTEKADKKISVTGTEREKKAIETRSIHLSWYFVKT